MYLRKLRRAGVELVSMTQEFRDDTTGNLIRQILGSFDEYQSPENAKHTLRAMQENARQGFTLILLAARAGLAVRMQIEAAAA